MDLLIGKKINGWLSISKSGLKQVRYDTRIVWWRFSCICLYFNAFIAHVAGFSERTNKYDDEIERVSE
jgi:hypothetical protein